MKIIANLEACVGAGNCASLADGFFIQDEATGLVRVKDRAVTAADVELLEEAVLRCPSRALRLER